jgi:uncharacterized Zn finger protein
MTILDRCDGPTCPACGCQQARVLREPRTDARSWWGSGRARCGHCGRVFAFREVAEDPTMPPAAAPDPAPPVPEPAPTTTRRLIDVITCQDCETRMRVVSTTKRVRYYRCPACGRTHKASRVDVGTSFIDL